MFAEAFSRVELAAIVISSWGSGTALVIYLWRNARVRHWDGAWIDGPDAERRRVAEGAKKVCGPVVYRHYDRNGEEVYVGQAGKRRKWWKRSNEESFADRMRNEGKEIMALNFAWWRAESVPRWALDDVERYRIWLARLRNPRLLNRTRGNGGRRRRARR